MRFAHVLLLCVLLLLLGCEGSDDTGSGYEGQSVSNDDGYAETYTSEPGFSEPSTVSDADDVCGDGTFPNELTLDAYMGALITACATDDGGSLLIVNRSPGVLRANPLVDMAEFYVTDPPANTLAATLMQQTAPDTTGTGTLLLFQVQAS